MPQSKLAPALPDLVISTLDYERLSLLLDGRHDPQQQQQADLLAAELARAQICDAAEMPPDVVTMNSRFTVQLGNGVSRTLTLVYPKDLMATTRMQSAEPLAAGQAAERVSVLAPVGAAVLGLREGSSIHWPLPNGDSQQLRVLALHYQPERSGDWHR